tara:strand:- start:52 stop:219 length:168 start_codon:yes stop_codon:yes gene_type:complete
MDSQDIQRLMIERFNKKAVKNSLCGCGMKKAFEYKTCCRCNNRKKKQMRNDTNKT